MKEKMVELVKESATDLGIKAIRLAGESLVKLAESLAHSYTIKPLKPDEVRIMVEYAKKSNDRQSL
jgi:hypothetical protein